MTIVTALKRSSTVSPTVVSRCWARPLRASGGTDWLSARNMSSRSGAVYWPPVRPVRSSVVSAAVKPHSRPLVAAIPEVTASSKRARGLAATSAGGGWMSCCGTASLSATTAVNGRGAARPARMEVATADRIACGVLRPEAPIHRRHQDLAAGFGLRSERAPQNRCQRVLSARHRRVMLNRNIKPASTYDGDQGSSPAPASAAQTDGSNGAATTSGE